MYGPSTLSPPSSFSNLVDRLADCSPGMTRTLAGPDSRDERIEALLHLGIERDVGRHFAFIFEIALEAVEQRHRAAQFLDVHAGRIAESGVADERDARIEPHAPGEGRRAHRDGGILLGGRALGNRGVGDQDRVVLADDRR